MNRFDSSSDSDDDDFQSIKVVPTKSYKNKKAAVQKTLSFAEQIEECSMDLQNILQNEPYIHDVLYLLNMPYLLSHYGYRDKESERLVLKDFTNTYITKFLNSKTVEIISGFIKHSEGSEQELLREFALNLTGMQRLRKLVDNNLMSPLLMQYIRTSMEWFSNLIQNHFTKSREVIDLCAKITGDSEPESKVSPKKQTNLAFDDSANSETMTSQDKLLFGTDTIQQIEKDLYFEIPLVRCQPKLPTKTRIQKRRRTKPIPWTLACILEAHRQMMIGAEGFEGAEALNEPRFKIEQRFRCYIENMKGDVELRRWTLENLAHAWCVLCHWKERTVDEVANVNDKNEHLLTFLHCAIVRKVKHIDQNLDHYVPLFIRFPNGGPLRFCVCVTLPMHRDQLQQCSRCNSDSPHPDQNILQHGIPVSDYKIQNDTTLQLVKTQMLPLYLKIFNHPAYIPNKADYELSTVLLRLVYWEGFVAADNISNISGLLGVWDVLVLDPNMNFRMYSKLAKFMWVVVNEFDKMFRKNSWEMIDNWRVTPRLKESKYHIFRSPLIPAMETLIRTLRQKNQEIEHCDDISKTDYWLKKLNSSNILTEYRRWL